MVQVQVKQSQMWLNQVQQMLLRQSKPKRKSGKSGGPRKKPRLCDVIEQSNEQIKQLQETMQSNSITSETRSKEREEDREFFRQMMGMVSQTMLGVTQMFMQGAASGYHSPNQAYTPPNYSFLSSAMGYGFYSPPARSSSSVTSETLSEDSDFFELVETEKSNVRLDCYMLSLVRDQS